MNDTIDMVKVRVLSMQIDSLQSSVMARIAYLNHMDPTTLFNGSGYGEAVKTAAEMTRIRKLQQERKNALARIARTF